METYQPYEMEWEIRKVDGTVRVLHTNGRPRFDDHGIFQGYRGIGRDVTEMRQSERVRERLIAELETKIPSWSSFRTLSVTI